MTPLTPLHVVVFLFTGVFLAGCMASPLPTTSGTSAAVATAASAVEATDAVFPAMAGGLPVTSVARAVELLTSGRLDGQAIAVAGYYDAVSPSCPAPSRFIGPLERWCSIDVLTDTRTDARLCRPEGSNGISCHGPTGTYLGPFLVSETSTGAGPLLTAGDAGEPPAVVFIGHAGDPRQWQCTAATQDTCAHAFVVDRVAWTNGSDVALVPPVTGNHQTGGFLPPARMTLNDIEGVLGSGSNVVAAAVLRAGDIATVDPRWNLAGDNLVWSVRSVAAAPQGEDPEPRPETTWLIDDAEGTVIDSQPMLSSSTYQPARLWQMATVHGYECCGGDLEAFWRLESTEGTALYEGLVSQGTSGGQGYTTFGGAYGSPPLVLPAGGYTFAVWLAPFDHGVMGSPSGECSAPITLRPLGDVVLNADFPHGGSCTIGPAPSPSLGP
jgi:hypothetical protein